MIGYFIDKYDYIIYIFGYFFTFTGIHMIFIINKYVIVLNILQSNLFLKNKVQYCIL